MTERDAVRRGEQAADSPANGGAAAASGGQSESSGQPDSAGRVSPGAAPPPNPAPPDAADPSQRSDPPRSGPPDTGAPSHSGPQPKGYRRIWLTLLVLGVLGAASLGYWQLWVRGVVSTDDARLDADQVDLAADLSGRLERLLVAEGDWIEAGRPVFALGDALLQVALQQAQANVETARASLGVAQAQLAKVLHGSRLEEVQIALDAEQQAVARSDLAKTEYDRTKGLYQRSAVTVVRLEQARASWVVAGHAQSEASHRLALLRHGARQEDIDAAKASADEANARLRAAQVGVSKARTELEHGVVRAPFSGYIVRVWRLPGASLAPGTPVVTMVNPATLRVEANIEEKDLGRISVGDPVLISIDAFPEPALTGTVSRVLRATNSTFSLIPAEGVSGTFIKVPQRVPIRIALDAPPRLPLGPGLSVVVRIRVSAAGALGPATVQTAAGQGVQQPAPQVPAPQPTAPVAAGAAQAGLVEMKHSPAPELR